MSKQILINIQKNIDEKNRKRRETFKVVLNKCIRQIEKASSFDKLFCLFQVPDFLIGYPLYPLEMCIEYLQKQLITCGFVVKYYFPNILYISWNKDEIRKERSVKDTNKTFVKSISSYKPSGKVVLNIT